MLDRYLEWLEFPPLLAPPPTSSILWSNNDLISSHCNTLKPSRRSSFKFPQLPTQILRLPAQYVHFTQGPQATS